MLAGNQQGSRQLNPAVLAAASLALVYLVLSVRPPGLARSLVKTASVALLALAALQAGAPALLAAAFLACAAGDALLSRHGGRAFAAGTGAFAAGHLLYILLFVSDPASAPARLLVLPATAAAGGLILLGLAAARLLAPRAGGLRPAVLAYIPVILGRGLAALTLQPGPVLAAASAFMASDLILAAETFLLPPGHRARRVTPYAVWILYWGAQAGFFAAFA